MFAELVDRLAFTRSRNAKLRLIANYFSEAPDPDRGYALAALTGTLVFGGVKPALVRGLAMARVDPVLFDLSHDYVGDLAETVALIWPRPAAADGEPPGLAQVVETLSRVERAEAPALVEDWLDRLDSSGRYALIKLITGDLRIGVSSRMAKLALAQWSHQEVEAIEESFSGLEPPFAPLFRWLTGDGPRPRPVPGLSFQPFMLAHPLENPEEIDPQAFAAEWKWDGIRVQIAARDGEVRLYSRTGDDIAAAFPDIAAIADFTAQLDGELLVGSADKVAGFNDLQQRLNRKTVSRRLLSDFPARVRVYDALFLDGDDLRTLPFDVRRQRLVEWHAAAPRPRLDLSPLVPFASAAELAAIRAGTRAEGIEGLVLKRRASPYLAGRIKGHWYKWKRDPLTADCVLLYAQRGSGRRSSYYSDFTFAAWHEGALVPVGKAYFGFTEAELLELDRFVRTNTVRRFGPVRELVPKLVLEVAFDSLAPSTRHRSGIAMRFPRIHRIRWDKPAEEADSLDSLRALLPADQRGET